MIIENALSLLVGCILHKCELINNLYEFSSEEIPNCDEFILTGLLYSNQEKIREEFKQSLSCLSLKLQNSSEKPPLFYMLRLLSSKFTIISEYPCKQYFELFCELIDQYFLIKSIGTVDATQVFNPETLLSLIIDKIKEYNSLSQKKPSNGAEGSGTSEDFEGIYIGLV